MECDPRFIWPIKLWVQELYGAVDKVRLATPTADPKLSTQVTVVADYAGVAAVEVSRRVRVVAQKSRNIFVMVTFERLLLIAKVM
jgi:hypothetical protein